MSVLHYGLLGLQGNWQLCVTFDGLLPLKLFNVYVKMLSDSQTRGLIFDSQRGRYLLNRRSGLLK